MRTLIVKTGNIRLDKFLLNEYPSLTFNMLQRFFKENKIKVNSKKIPLNSILNDGDEIKIFILDKYLGEETAILDKASIIYEDDNILVVNKPAGLITIDENVNLDSLNNRIKSYLSTDNGSVCHRLDRGTSGLVIFAKNANIENVLLDAIKHHKLRKFYRCVTFGWPKPNCGEIHNYLLKDDSGYVKAFNTQIENSKEAITKYKTIATKDELALIDLEILTGRTHQIRVHMKSLSCPILGDSKYGNESANRKYKKNRQCLCAYKIILPIFSGNFEYLSNMEFSIPAPTFNLF